MLKILKKFSFFLLFFFFIRLILIFFYPADHELKYEVVADNILSGCGVSFSLQGSNECIPAFGPNGPGYPFFLASLRLFFDNDYFIRIFQIVVYFISVLFVKKAIYQFTKSKNISNITFIALSISPLTLGWSRFILPETIIISLTLFFLGFVIKSLIQKKNYILEFSLILILMTFIRVDSIFFIFPVIYLIFTLNKFNIGIKKLAIFLLIFSIPWSIWSYRNYLVGANLFPNTHESYETIAKKTFPFGYNKWILSWAYQQHEFAAALNPTHIDDNNFKYENIKINNNIYFNKKEQKETEKLLDKLKVNSGKHFPLNIDEEFRNLANSRINENKLFYYFILPIKRFINIWFNPYYSHGLPIELTKKLNDKNIDINKRNFIEKVSLIKLFPVQIFLKLILFSWMLFLVILFVLIFFQKKNFNLKCFYLICLQLVFLKTMFYGYTGFFETRYIVNLIPLIEVLIILAFNHALRKSE